MYQFIDSHCHFDFPVFAGDEAASLIRAQAAGVRQIIIPSVAATNFSRVLALTRHSALYAALGLHPVMIAHHQDSDLQQLEQQLSQKPAKLVAIGETGLDLYMRQPDFSRQKMLLIAQLQLAKRYDLPVILHSRRTHDQLASLLKQHNLSRTGVVHGFSGSLQQAQRFVALGYKIGVGGTITYLRAAKTRAVIAQLPLSSLLLETDAPDMPVYGRQGQANRPERLAEIFVALCQLRPEPPAQIASVLLENTRQLFALV